MKLKGESFNPEIPNFIKLSSVFQNAVARALINALYDHGGKLFLTPDDESIATYTPFRGKFVNEICVDFGSDETDPEYTISANAALFHEAVHGLQWGSIPILHASPYNNIPDMPSIVLCPEDWIRMVLLTEHGAYAKQAWLISEASKTDPGFLGEDKKSPVNSDEFNAFYERSGNLVSALVASANHAFTKTCAHEPEERPRTFTEHYIANALTTYEENNHLKKPAGIIFVRMEDDDLVTSSAIGPRILGNKDLSAWRDLNSLMTPEQQTQLNKMNGRLGIHDKNVLPTLTQVLEKYGHTLQSYMALSKQPLEAAPELVA
jgi:hypothetical protein